MSKDDTAANETVVADATTTESAPVEDKSVTADNALDDDAFDDIDDSAELSEETEGNEEEQASPEPPNETETEQLQGEQPASPKNEWDSLNGKAQDRFRQAINERNELRQRLAEVEARKAQTAREQDLVSEINPETGDWYTPQEAERIAFVQSRQEQQERLEQEQYSLQVQQNQDVIGTEARQIVEDFPAFRQFNADGSPNPEFDQPTVSAYEQELANNLIYELPNGERYTASVLVANGINPFQQATLVGSNVRPYQLAKLIADSSARAAARGKTFGQVNAQKATETMLANADIPAGSSQAHGSKDSDLDDFDKAWDE